MKAVWGGIFGAWLLASAIVASAPAVAETATGATYVTTLPGGAEVWCDGTYVGRSPLLVDGLAEGRHTISLLKGGWTAQEILVTVVRGTVVMSSSRLAASKLANLGSGVGNGTLVLRETPPGADVLLDGAPLSQLPPHGLALPAGTHEVSIKTARGRTTRSVSIYPDTTTDVILREETGGQRARSAVVAAAEDYLPTDAFVVSGRRIVVRYARHVVVAHFGEKTFQIDGATVAYDSAPESFGGKLYLPLSLLEKLSGDVSKSP